MRAIRTVDDLADALAAVRHARGLSQLALDDRIGLTAGHIGKLEKPAQPWGRKVSWETLAWWLEALDAALFVGDANLCPDDFRKWELSPVTRGGLTAQPRRRRPKPVHPQQLSLPLHPPHANDQPIAA